MILLYLMVQDCRKVAAINFILLVWLKIVWKLVRIHFVVDGVLGVHHQF